MKDNNERRQPGVQQAITKDTWFLDAVGEPHQQPCLHLIATSIAVPSLETTSIVVPSLETSKAVPSLESYINRNYINSRAFA